MTDDQMIQHNVGEGVLPSFFPAAILTEILPGVEESHAKDFLVGLQRAHDRAMNTDFVVTFKLRANEVANKFGLTPIA
jgi:hypothetical protein